MRLWVAAALVWVAGATAAHWSAIEASWHMLSIDLGARPTPSAADRALLERDCDALPSARERARCELDQSEIRRTVALWEAASAELRQRRAEAWRTLGFALAAILLPPAALLLTGRLIARVAAGNDKRGGGS
jgi:hypothetical protein